MMKERKKGNSQEEIFDQFYDLNSVASATGLTGMTPALPKTDEELVAYAKIQGIPNKH
jgi:hypothetical protein